jgi:putative RNA 2'-phosphotransferase
MYTTRHSKFLSLILRHAPDAGNITLDPNGWADIRKVVEAVRSKYGNFNRADLEQLVAENDKQRFVIERDKIRANQGHTAKVDLQLEPTAPPDILYHGTKTSNLPSIFEKGILRGKRLYVHLSPSIETAQIVANRRQGKTAIIVLKTENMSVLKFFKSANGVWLTEFVPAACVKDAEILYQ